MGTVMLVLCILGQSSPDLLIVERDIRHLEDPEVLQEFEVIYVSTDWFLALGEGESLEGGFTVIQEGPLELEDYSLVHLREEGDVESAGAVGTVLFCRGQVALVRNRNDIEGFPVYPGVHFVQPLRVYSPRALEPFRPVPLSDPDITSIVDAVDQDSLLAVIQRLEDFETRLCITDSFYNASLWTRDKLQSYGFDAQVEDFEFVFYGNTYTSYNVVAEKPGIIQPDIYVIICGHLDSITMQNPMETAPGADDNGSGSAAVIEAARILSDYNFRHTLRFICFGAEELGLHGSEYYAQQAAANGDSIIAVMNLDMILYGPEEYRKLFVPYNSVSEELAMNMWEISSTYVPELELDVVYSPGTTYSDHASFWAQGYPALLGIEEGVDQNPYYHQESDLLANYMQYFPFGTECAKAAIATVAVYADPLPEGIEGGGTPISLIASVGPLPATSGLTVMLTQSNSEIDLSLYDIAGREVSRISAGPGSDKAVMNTGDLPSGVYSLMVRSGVLSESRTVVVVR
jgi:hypothetical protein